MAKAALSQWNTTQGTSPAYTQAVPTLAQKCAEVKMLGGHTALVEQQLVSALVTKISVTDADNQVVYEKAIPASVQALAGYGWSAGTYYNYIDFAQKKYHQVIGTRAHQSGDEDDPTVITDGTNTYYKLTTEVVTDISAALTDYCLLEITDATTVTFTNAAGLSVPNTVNYAITQRTNGAVFDDNISSADDLALIQQTVTVQPATPKTNIIEIPGADGYIDLTEALGVGVKYNARQITWTFALYPNASWYDKQSAVSNAINGLSCRITLDSDPVWYYEGRITVEKYQSSKLLKQIVVKAVCKPYKISKITGERSL